LFPPTCLIAKVSKDVVVHLAAAKGGGIVHSMAHHGSLFRDNMLSCINVLDAARQSKPRRVVMVSSACVYPRDASVPTPEEDGSRDAPEPTNAGYGWSKRMCEYLAQSYAEEYGLNIGIVRPYNTYGPRDDFFKPASHVIPGIITRLLNGENPLTIWGTGKQTRSFLYVEDSARGILQAGPYENVTGPINLGSEEETSIARLAELIVEVSGLDVEITFDTSKPDGQPRRTCDTSKAKSLIGYQTRVNLREGLQNTVEWYREQLLKRAG
jgi:GDP-L-fucose synthase